MLEFTFLNGEKASFKKGVHGFEVVNSISKNLLESSLGLVLNGQIFDLQTPLTESGELRILNEKDEEALSILRHSAAHLMAYAVRELYPSAKMTIGPVIDEGFFYDFDDLEIGSEAFESIEKKMRELAEGFKRFDRVEISREEADRLFGNNPYKKEIIQELPEFEAITYYTLGENFIDLCRGPHVLNTSFIKHFKILKTAGAYWRGKSDNKMLRRLYGTAFFKKEDLENYLAFLEEASKRDHRRLGKDLSLFFFNEVSPGSPFFLWNGAAIYNELQSFMREEYLLRGYKEVITPMMYYKDLWETSGHWGHYREDMFQLLVDNIEGALKPMNCPSHMLIYKQNPRSYRDLPLRIADFGALHRNEIKGSLGGLTRVRKFSQDDAHIFCREDQIFDEICAVIDFADKVYVEVFDFEYNVVLSTRPENFMGELDVWNEAENSLKGALEAKQISYQINEGDGAFYGPKIDFRIKDALNRSWQCVTIQLDFQNPINFDLTYEGSDGKKHRAVVIHRAILGSLERFIGILTEHYVGRFPFWLSPEQARFLTVSDKFHEDALRMKNDLLACGVRVDVDNRSESLGRKIRDAELMKIPFIVTLGEKEIQNKTLSVRAMGGKTKTIPYEEFKNLCLDLIKNRKKTINLE